MVSGGPFEAAAWYYARYRPAYPSVLFDRLRERFRLDGKGRMLDLGCGPGHLAIPLAGDFEHVVGLDPEPEMLAEARRISEERNAPNITWIEGSSDDLASIKASLDDLRLVTMGHSFGWMDREAVLRDLDGMVVPGGGIAFVEDEDATWGPPNTLDVVNEVLRRHVGKTHRHGGGHAGMHDEPDAAVIARSPFSRTETHRFPERGETNIDRMIGFLYSTSFASLRVLGDERKAFERDLRATLEELQPSGTFQVGSTVVATLAWRP